MREHESVHACFRGKKAPSIGCDPRLIGGNGIFEVLESNHTFKRRKLNREVVAWRLKTIRAASCRAEGGASSDPAGQADSNHLRAVEADAD